MQKHNMYSSKIFSYVLAVAKCNVLYNYIRYSIARLLKHSYSCGSLTFFQHISVPPVDVTEHICSLDKDPVDSCISIHLNNTNICLI